MTLESARTADPALDLRQVTVVRAGRALLDRASLRVGRGEYWAMLGRNGAGKSTLLAVCGARLHPSSGTADVLGQRLGRVEIAALHPSIGHVNPRHDIRSDMPLRTVVLTGLTGTTERRLRWKPSPADLTRVDALLRMTGLVDRADHRWPHLSQGERGRALIARALVNEPSLLLLDEPTTGLDLAAREQFLETLARVEDVIGLSPTVIHVTHSVEELPERTSHAALVRDGQVVAAGPVESTLTSAVVSDAYDHPIEVEHHGGRWRAHGRRQTR